MQKQKARSGVLSTEEAAEFLGFSTRTLECWRWERRGPRYLKIGRAVRYRLIDLEAFLNSAVIDTTVEA